MFIVNMVVVLAFCVSVFAAVRLFLYRSALVFALRKWSDWIDDRIHVHQFFKVPQLNQNAQENQLYRKVFVYVNSLSSLEDSDFINLVKSGGKSNDILLCLDDNQVVQDQFLGARISWMNKVESGGRSLVLRIKKKDKRRILRPYLQHIQTVSDNIGQRRRELKLFMNRSPSDDSASGRWRSVPFTHPSTFDTVVMESDLKNRVKSDLETFLKSQQYYHKLGRVWRRSFLLYGPSGTGKSSFIAAIANFLNYDVYDIDLSRVSDDSDLKLLLLQTASKSVIVVEDVDRLIQEKLMAVSFSGLLNFMDGIVNSCCGDEKIMVFTMNCKDHIDPAMLRPGRIDVHIHFPLCDFNSFKCLANSYLGVKEHKLFPQVEEIFQTGATLSPAEIGELMLVHRSSPSRAIKTVITALQTDGRHGGRWRRLTEISSLATPSPQRTDEQGCATWKDTVPVAKEFRKLYGLLRMKSAKRSEPLDHDLESIQR
nr:AAA-ATPase At2g46620-like [Ipomoea trifida]